MARGTQHRKRRPTANASVAARTAPSTRRPKRPRYEEQLFFGRLRNHAKILFVLMAAVFILSFVFLGVGSGSTGISQALQSFFSGGSSATGASLGSLQKATVQHPKDAAAWLAYANKLQAANQLDQAAAALTTYTTLRPKDTNQLRVLASLYYRRAIDWNTVYGDQSSYAQTLNPSLLLQPKTGSKLGQALSSVSNPLTSAVTSQTSSASSNAYQQLISDLNQRLQVYKKLAKLLPNDASTQLELGQAATDAGDTASEIAGYKAFLRLAPNDSQAPAARQALKRLGVTKP